MDGSLRFRMSAAALRQTLARLRRRPQAWLGALAVVVGTVIAWQAGLIPVSLTKAETGKLVPPAKRPDAHREPVYHPRIVPDVVAEVSSPNIEMPTEPLTKSPTDAPTELPNDAPVTPFHPVPATAPVERQNVVAMTSDPRSAAPVAAPVSPPPFVTPSLAASAVWPRLRGDGPVRAVAVVFLGVDCPTSAAKLPRLSRVHATWGELGVRLVGIIVGAEVTPAEATEFRSAHRLRFPVMTDRSGALQQLLSPTHTPEVFVLRPNGEVAYRGRIDDDGLPPEQLQHGPRRVHIENALAAVIAGWSPAVSRTAPVGHPLTAPGTPSQGLPASAPASAPVSVKADRRDEPTAGHALQ